MAGPSGSSSSSGVGSGGWRAGYVLRLILPTLVCGWVLGYVTTVFFSSQPAWEEDDDMTFFGSMDAPSGAEEQTPLVPGIAVRPWPPGQSRPRDPMDYPKPRTFFDVEIDGQPAGRIVFELFTKQAPRAAENFRALCTGEKGRVPMGKGLEGEGRRLHYKGAEFYRVIDQFICQTGIDTGSIYGGAFDDDELALMLKHDRGGLLSAANIGPNTTTTHFSIVVAPAPHLNGHYPIFGQVVEGMSVVEAINKLAKPQGSEDERPRLRAVIANCGELVCGQLACREVTLIE